MKWNRFSTILLLMALLTLLTLPTSRAEADDVQPDQASQPDAKDDRDSLERGFSEKLSGATLVGMFSVDGQKTEKPPQAERYVLESVVKHKGDYWVFLARIQYGNIDVKVPITLKVLWAGDTPMISLTDFTIPGMGTFTARVMFYGDRYAGTWQHGKAGGHMWGLIEPPKQSVTPQTKQQSETPRAEQQSETPPAKEKTDSNSN